MALPTHFMGIKMSIFTGTFVLDDSPAQNTIAKTNIQLGQQESQISTNRHKLTEYFQWAMHMANIWGSYLARTAQGQATMAKYAKYNTALNILSAQLSIALTINRGLSDIGTGQLAAGYFQLALATSMEYIMVDMQNLQLQQEEAATALAEGQSWFAAYGGNG
jgi:hypothetical protein